MSANFINNGIKLIKEAIEADEKKDYETAYNQYTLGANNFLTGLKYEKSAQVKKTLLTKVEKYISRAEVLKEQIKNQKKKLQNEGDIPEQKDDEKTKMENSMSNAIIVENPNVKWDDVAGLEKAKAMLKEAVILPIKFPDLFTGMRKPWRGILLYGPPGTGKSFLAKAVATEAGNSTFFAVSSSDLVSKYLGESEKLVRTLFETARKNSPAIIFIDEIDSLCGSRSDGEHDATRRIKTEFLVQMQGVKPSDSKVLVLGATNTPWQLDPAIRRRFEKRVFIALPDAPARERMFRLMVGDTPNELKKGDFAQLGEKTEGFSGSDIDSFTRDALYEPVRLILQSHHFKECTDPETNEKYYLPCSVGDAMAQKIDVMNLPQNAVRPRKLRLIDFLRVLPNATRSVSAKDLGRYTEWTEEYGTEG